MENSFFLLNFFFFFGKNKNHHFFFFFVFFGLELVAPPSKTAKLNHSGFTISTPADLIFPPFFPTAARSLTPFTSTPQHPPTLKPGPPPTLVELCVHVIAENSEGLPHCDGSLPEEISQKILDLLIRWGKLNMEKFQKLLDPRASSLSLAGKKYFFFFLNKFFFFSGYGKFCKKQSEFIGNLKFISNLNLNGVFKFSANEANLLFRGVKKFFFFFFF